MDRRRMRPNELKKNMICLGKQGENGAMALVFDCAEWLAEYPAGTIRLYVQTAGREEYYPPLGIEGTDRVYVINSEKATKTAGNGVIELLLIDSASGTTIKSATGYTTVRRSPSAGLEETDGEPGYVRYDAAQTLTDDQKAQARANIGAGTGSGNGEGTGEPGADGEDGGYYTPAVDASGNLTWSASKAGMPSVPSANIKGPAGRDGNDGKDGPQGLPGRDGRGIVSIERTSGDGSAGTVDTYTITYTDGSTTTYTVTNGKNGQNASGDGTLAVEIDETLSISGAAADAKMTGDRLNELKEANAAQDTEIAKKANDADLAKVAKSGSYTDLTNKPTIPTVPESLKNPNKLKFTGAVTAEYDGSAPVSVEIPAGGGGNYTLPVASATQLGGVMPAAKTDEMTQAVGVDAEGKLFTTAGAGGERIVAQETVLASGVIPNETPGETLTETGLTLGDLRRWKRFAYLAISTVSGYYRPFINGKQILFNINGLRPFAIYEWVDSKKTLIQPFLYAGANGALTSLESVFFKENSTSANPTKMDGFVPMSFTTFNDSAPVQMQNHAATTCEVQWKIVGLLKYGE